MPSVQSIGHPLVLKVDQGSTALGENLHASAKSVDTHLFVKLEGSKQDAQRLLKMGEQTCFLHAAMRASNRTQLRAEINGVQVEIEPGFR